MTSIYTLGALGAVAVAATLVGAPAHAAAVASRDAVATAQTDSIVEVGRRGRRNAGYAAAGVLGLATGALIVGANRDRYDDEYYEDRPRRVYVEPRRRYYRERCEYVRYRENRYGEVVRVVTYRPC